jgi:hypothetical protein
MRLWLAGLIEPDTEDGWTKALANRIKDVGWHLVVDVDRREDVAARARTRRERNSKSAEQQAKRIVEALEDPTVNRLVLAMTKDTPGSARGQRHAAKALRKQHVDRVQQAKNAARDKAADAEFKRMLKHLWDARGAVAAIDAHLIQERARVANGEARRIANQDWLVALNDVRTIIKSFGSMWQNIRDVGDPNEPCPACGAPQIADDRHLRAFAVDSSAEIDTDGGEGIVDADVVSN